MSPAFPTAEALCPRGGSCGVWFSSSLSTKLPAHTHEGPELNLIMVGSIVVLVDGQPERVRAGELLVLPAGSSHQLVESSHDAALWVLECDRDPGPWTARVQVRAMAPDWAHRLVGLARKLWLRPDAPQASRLEGQMRELLGSGEFLEQPRPVSTHPAVRRARQVCERQVQGELDVEQLAAKAGVSASRLAHLFQQQVGITPLQYRNYVRVQHFIRSQNAGERNLLRAAIQAGFGSYPQFHRVFRQVCGRTPGAHFDWLEQRSGVDAKQTLGSRELDEQPLSSAS